MARCLPWSDCLETVEVLKGASAGAIYGSGGSNGIIVITTKRGRAGTAEIGVIQRFGTQMLSNKLGERCFSSGAEVDAAGYDSTGFGAAAIKCHDYEQELACYSALAAFCLRPYILPQEPVVAAWLLGDGA